LSETTKVRTTLRPDEELEVGPQELTDLRAQGLLLEDSAPQGGDVRRPAEQRVAVANEEGK